MRGPPAAEPARGGLDLTVRTPLDRFADDIGAEGPVAVVGGRTQWTVGGEPAPGTREVRPPAGVVEHVPAEMTVRVRAGTTIEDLHAALAEGAQTVALPAWPSATVGGVLAVGRSGLRRLGDGPVREGVLELRVVTAGGRLVKAGGPTVKNVSGFDLCRLFVGSLGTLAMIGEAVLRTRPLPVVSQWYAGEVDPFDLHRRLYRPTSILWDGSTTWVLLEGHPADVTDQVAGTGLTQTEKPPALPTAHRQSVRPSQLRDLAETHPPGTFVAEVGVGLVHLAERGFGTTATVPPPVLALHRRLKQTFDPAGRLNPGREVTAA